MGESGWWRRVAERACPSAARHAGLSEQCEVAVVASSMYAARLATAHVWPVSRCRGCGVLLPRYTRRLFIHAAVIEAWCCHRPLPLLPTLTRRFSLALLPCYGNMSGRRGHGVRRRRDIGSDVPYTPCGAIDRSPLPAAVRLCVPPCCTLSQKTLQRSGQSSRVPRTERGFIRTEQYDSCSRAYQSGTGLLQCEMPLPPVRWPAL